MRDGVSGLVGGKRWEIRVDLGDAFGQGLRVMQQMVEQKSRCCAGCVGTGNAKVSTLAAFRMLSSLLTHMKPKASVSKSVCVSRAPVSGCFAKIKLVKMSFLCPTAARSSPFMPLRASSLFCTQRAAS